MNDKSMAAHVASVEWRPSNHSGGVGLSRVTLDNGLTYLTDPDRAPLPGSPVVVIVKASDPELPFGENVARVAETTNSL